MRSSVASFAMPTLYRTGRLIPSAGLAPACAVARVLLAVAGAQMVALTRLDRDARARLADSDAQRESIVPTLRMTPT
ncbi:hypothetical protein BG454_04990 [Roseinatronobacter bogoriensis subsp. barguzinensis]|uniref:Uncharacterized protein n=1 Tax=Roseinatronobacter bogoriensis subsp. barguzinensis TaxID=441209 RepID=A0A2K8K726_9RHOB|nr:hypothetical protein BG454_04990 [Rhodobaca barguzinensis]